ncbi:MAG: hypothetical protein V3S14_16135 [Anaerolineae bacterium]
MNQTSKTYISPQLRLVAQEARYRCGYCLTAQRVIGLTATGRATVVALRLNNDEIVATRLLWVQVGWHPPAE